MTTLCTSRFAVVQAGSTLYLPYCRNHSLNRRNASITRAVFALHGAETIANMMIRIYHRVRFRDESSAGAVGFSDVVLWSQRYI